MEKENKELTTKKEKNKKEHKLLSKIKENLKNKWLIKGTTTLALILVIIAIYIGINLILDKVVLPEIDCTQNKVYSLSQETKDKLKNLDKDISITLINFSSSESTINFAERYTEINKNIKIERIDDLSTRSDLMQKYSLDATGQLIIVACGDKEKTISTSDLYTYDYTTYQQVDKTEEAITNAIVDVITEKKPKIYFMSNHLMYGVQYYSTITTKLEEESNEVENLDIFSEGKIPEDCDTLVITTLKEDITEQEKDLIINYINNGGKILLMCGPNITGANLSNFQQVLDLYGITIENGVVFEGEKSNMLSGYPDFIIEQTQNTSLTQNMNMSLNLCLADAGKITFNEDKLSELGVEYETLAQTSDSAFLRTNLNQTSATKTTEDGENTSIIVAAIATKKISDEKTSKLIVYSNELFAMDMQVQINGYKMYTVNLYNNKDIILNSISYLNEREDTITIRKNYDSVTYTVTEQQNNIIMAIIFIIPIIIIILGIIIWQVRRRKK